jgi:hypothetical protein
MEHGEINVDICKKVNPNSDLEKQIQTCVEFSIKVVEALSHKTKEYNSNSSKKISLSQLKKVYVKGASFKEGGDKTSGQWAMARVNMFLRLISSNTFKDTFNKKKGGISLSKFEIDVTENWTPSEEDFAQALIDIEKFKLDYDFKDVEELYLNENPARFSFEV